MKKKYIIKYALLLVFAVCLIAGSINGGFAKYASTKTSVDTVTVARWAFNVNNKNIVKEDFVFDLFENTDIIAPGMTGSFTLNLENTSEVPAEYGIEYEVTNTSGIPVVFSADGGDTWLPELEEVEMTPIASGASDTITIKWKWDTNTDVADTQYGTMTTLSTVTVSAKVSANQVIA